MRFKSPVDCVILQQDSISTEKQALYKHIFVLTKYLFEEKYSKNIYLVVNIHIKKMNVTH